MDSSQTISPESFQAQKDFVKSVARYFEIIPTRTRSGVVNFGSDPTMSIQLNDYTDVHSFVRAVDVVPLLGGGKRLDKALVYAARILSKGRRGAQKIALVLTDGRQGSHVGADQFRDAARALHSLGVKTYAVGVGDGVNFGVMSAVSVKPDDVFYVRTFARLLQLAPSVTSHIISGELKNGQEMLRAQDFTKRFPGISIFLVIFSEYGWVGVTYLSHRKTWTKWRGTLVLTRW